MATLGTHIPAEITDYKEKVIGGLTLRQLAAGAAALLAGGLTFLLCWRVFGLTAEQASYAIMAAATIPAAFGFLRPMNMDLEKYILIRYRHWLRSGSVPYKTMTTTRGDPKHDYVRQKKRPEYTVPYVRPDRRRERRFHRQTRKQVRRAWRETRKIQRAWRKAQRKAQRSQKHQRLPVVRPDN